MKKIIPLTSREHEILSYLYQLRILSLSQIYEKWFRYNSEGTETQIESCRTMLTRFEKKKGCITSFKHPLTTERCYQLTQEGLNSLRAYGLCFIGTTNKRFVNEDFLSLSKLTLNERLYSHQLCLNQFLLNFEAEQLPVPWEYFDEKFVSCLIKGVRPDGILRINNVYYFLEMDMDTERAKALETKWQHYRAFLKSSEFLNFDGRIEVLFLVNSFSPAKRALRLRTSMFDGLFDKFGYKFDAIFGTVAEISQYLLDTVFENILDVSSSEILTTLSNAGFKLKERPLLKQNFDMCAFSSFVKCDMHEFFVCDFRYAPTAVIHDIYNWVGTQLEIRKNTGRNIPYLIISNSLEDCYSVLATVGITFDETDIFYTSLMRLQISPLHEAIVRFDSFGNVFHFQDKNCTHPVLEYTITKKL